MEAKKVNKFGRSFSQGVALNQDLTCLIVDTISIKEGGRSSHGLYSLYFCEVIETVLCVEEDSKIRVTTIL